MARPQQFRPPWVLNGIGKHPYIDSPVRMIDISRIRPEHGRNLRPPKLVDPNAPYLPLVIDAMGVLQDGYHRYYDLIDEGYTGKVPVVIYQ